MKKNIGWIDFYNIFKYIYKFDRSTDINIKKPIYLTRCILFKRLSKRIKY